MRFDTFAKFDEIRPALGRVDIFLKRDQTLWAIKRSLDGRPLKAIGPISQDFAKEPRKLNWRESIDATGWAMGDFTLVFYGTRIGHA